MWAFGDLFQDAATPLGSLFTLIGTVAGAYFGIKVSNDTSARSQGAIERAHGRAEEANERAQQAHDTAQQALAELDPNVARRIVRGGSGDATRWPILNLPMEAANLSGGDLKGANLSRALLWEADLSGVEHLTKEQLAEVKGDETNKLPPDLKPPSTGAWSLPSRAKRTERTRALQFPQRMLRSNTL
jgi:pentapeptide repeat protein